MSEYLRRQKRFAHLFDGEGHPDVVERLQAFAERNIDRFGLTATAERSSDVGEEHIDANIGLLDALATGERGPA